MYFIFCNRWSVVALTILSTFSFWNITTTEAQEHQKSFNHSREQKAPKIMKTEGAVSTVIATTSKGKYRGRLRYVMGTEVATFLGMRYAEAPTGEKRFKKPTPVQGWNGTRDALRYSNSCYQWVDDTFGPDHPGTGMWNPNTPLSEDCLFLNVWSPNMLNNSEDMVQSNNTLLAVMCWIYGGGYYSGTASLDVYDGTWLAATQEVVVVSMNYRVAALGFLTFGSPDAPGNAGLWDQNTALLWIRENIENFGGDPSRITLFGESSGAASIGMHIMSTHSNELFQNAILQSASLFSPWAILPKSILKKRAYNLALSLGCSSKANNTSPTAEEMLPCLQAIDPKKLVDKEIFMEDLGTARFPNAAIIDEDFVTSKALQQFQSGKLQTKINVLAGFNRNEGNYYLAYSTDGFQDDEPITYSQYHAGLAKGLWGYRDQPINAAQAKNFHPSSVLLNAIDFRYSDFGALLRDRERCASSTSLESCVGAQTENPYKNILDRIVGDISFACPVIYFLKTSLKSSTRNSTNASSVDDVSGKTKSVPNHFLYKFLHRSSQTPWPKWMGTLHGYEIEFVFGIPLNQSLNYTNEERDLSKMMMVYWTNFAKFGNPNSITSQANMGKWTTKTSIDEWVAYGEDREASLVFDINNSGIGGKEGGASSHTEENVKSKDCSFWSDYYPEIMEYHSQGRPRTCARLNQSKSSARRAASADYLLKLVAIFCYIRLCH